MTWNNFEIDRGGGEISFMITLGDSLFIGTAKEDGGIVECIHELKTDKTTNKFKVKGGEIWRRRSRTPLFERIALQFNDIINLLSIDTVCQEKAMANGTAVVNSFVGMGFRFYRVTLAVLIGAVA